VTSTAPADPQEPAPPSRLRRFLVPLVFAAVVSVLGAVALVLHGMGTAAPGTGPGPSVSGRGIIIACPVPTHDDSYCRRLASDVVRRRPLTDREREAGQQTAAALRRALARQPTAYAGHCEQIPPTGTVPPPCHWIPEPVTAEDVQQVRQALLAAGFTDVTVRLATAQDPAPVGTLLYAVRAGNACVIGNDLDRSAPRGLGLSVVGRLPDGSCLKP
jgi:hypothetical protein